jgi:hypothetical protein
MLGCCKLREYALCLLWLGSSCRPQALWPVFMLGSSCAEEETVGSGAAYTALMGTTTECVVHSSVSTHSATMQGKNTLHTCRYPMVLFLAICVLCLRC